MRVYKCPKMEAKHQAVQAARKSGKLPLGGKCHFVRFKDNGTRGMICGWNPDGRVVVSQKGVERVARLSEFDVISDKENALLKAAGK